MATGITVNHSIHCENGNLQFDTPAASFTATQANGRFSASVQDIGTTHEQVVIASDVATAGISWFKNLDTTNFVTIGLLISGTYYPFKKLLPGESYPIRLATNTIYAKADTLAVKLQTLVFDA